MVKCELNENATLRGFVSHEQYDVFMNRFNLSMGAPLTFLLFKWRLS